MSDEWVETTLGDVLDVIKGTVQDADVSLILSVTEKRGIIPQTEVFNKRIATTDISEYKVLEPLDIAYNPYLLWAGAVGQWLGGENGATSPVYECFRVRPSTEPRFIGLLLESGLLTPYFDSTAIGSIQRRRRTTVSVFQQAHIHLPSRHVQRRIVDLMNHLDRHLANLRAERDAVIRTLDAARIELTASWELQPLGELCSVVAPLVDPRSDEYADLLHIGIERMEKDGGRLLPLETARAERLISSKYLFSDSDVIFSKIRPNLRKVVLPRFVGLCSADAYPLTPIQQVPGALLREVLLLPSVTEQIVGKSTRTKMPKVNRRELMGVNVPMTSDIGERCEATTVLESLRLAASAVESEFSRLNETRAVLLAALLQGAAEIPETYNQLLVEVA